MSKHKTLTDRVWESITTSPTEKLILLCLAYQGSRNSGRITDTNQELAQACRILRQRTFDDLLKDLIAEGIVTEKIEKTTGKRVLMLRSSNLRKPPTHKEPKMAAAKQEEGK